ncbi:DUF6461 domain-containing protein [Actinoplanes sp. NPDC051861]|uniref:DUF6461 domain-containing protein n=1 Tax=Actinoplanes sp. NPDC051861 TaxID=3155170 RepID=UPI0034350995
MVVSADDYAWFTEQCPELADGYRLTLVHGRATSGGAARGGAASGPIASGLGGAAAVSELGEWTLIVEPDGVRGDGGRAVRELSRGTVVVAHSASLFEWVRDGEVVLEFDPADAGNRRGSDPDGLVEVLERLGFDLSTDDADTVTAGDARHRERALALAEQLTGVRLNLESLPETARNRPAQPARPAAQRRWSRGDSWDDEYEIDDDDEFGAEDREEGDQEEREGPRLARRLGRLFR